MQWLKRLSREQGRRKKEQGRRQPSRPLCLAAAESVHTTPFSMRSRIPHYVATRAQHFPLHKPALTPNDGSQSQAVTGTKASSTYSGAHLHIAHPTHPGARTQLAR
ncbi:hypothetical protein FPV67DRAFT_1666751 [Lyophyllum atratum]|nr:hypothetical protein FPV67DRAFT_1666751 [Lyophyllum atratum]